MKPVQLNPSLQLVAPSDDVGTALGLLQDALGDEEQRIRTEGARAMQNGDFDTATEVIEFAKRLLAFREKVGAVEREWSELEALRDRSSAVVQEIVGKRFFGRRASGEITSHNAYCRPLLEVLVNIGGGGRTRDVLDRLGEKMRGVLKPKDYEPHESGAKQIRWRNTAQWARNHMVNEETPPRMKTDSKNGWWEISNHGRTWLAMNQPKLTRC
jgi:restriction system protein